MPVSVRNRRLILVAVAVAGGGLLATVLLAGPSKWDASNTDARKATVEKRPFEQLIRRRGEVQPISQQKVFPGVSGTILSIVDDGAHVDAGDTILQLDPKPHEEALERHEASMRQMKAEWIKEEQKASVDLRSAQDKVKLSGLRLNLEEVKAKELKAGPDASKLLNAQTTLTNAKAIHEALTEELSILRGLADEGYYSRSEVRQKELEVTEQGLKVAEAEVALKKLYEPDPVVLAEQNLKVRDATKNLEADRERAALLDRNLNEAQTRFARNLKRATERYDELKENIEKTKQTAPIPGVAVVSTRWGMRWGPGRDVWNGHEVMTLTDLRRMKVLLTVDEGRIARIEAGQEAVVHPMGNRNVTFGGKVTKVAGKGRDEFQDLRPETKAIVGDAERQVFEVEIELEEKAAADLRPGQRVDVDIIVERLAEALVVPRAALASVEGGAKCVRVETPQGPERRMVRVLAEDGLFCAVENAPSAGGAAEAPLLEAGQRVWLLDPSKRAAEAP